MINTLKKAIIISYTLAFLGLSMLGFASDKNPAQNPVLSEKNPTVEITLEYNKENQSVKLMGKSFDVKNIKGETCYVEEGVEGVIYVEKEIEVKKWKEGKETYSPTEVFKNALNDLKGECKGKGLEKTISECDLASLYPTYLSTIEGYGYMKIAVEFIENQVKGMYLPGMEVFKVGDKLDAIFLLYKDSTKELKESNNIGYKNTAPLEKIIA